MKKKEKVNNSSKGFKVIKGARKVPLGIEFTEEHAIELINNGKLNEAERIYKILIDKDKKNYMLFGNLGAICLMKGQIDNSMKFLKKALEIEPHFVDGLNNMGSCLKLKGRWEEAIRSFKKAIKLRPTYSQAHCNLGSAYKAIGQINDAIESYNRAIENSPNYADPYNNLGNCLLSLGRNKEAVDAYESCIKINSNSHYAYIGLASALNTLGKSEEAIIACKKGIELNRNDAISQFQLAKIYSDQGKYTSAIHHYKLSIERDSKLASTFHNLGNCLKRIEKFEEAIKNYKKGLLINKDFTECIYSLGYTLIEIGRVEEGLVYINNIISRDENHYEALTVIGVVKLENNNINEAEFYLKKALSINPKWYEALNVLGNIKQTKGKYNESIQLYEKAIKERPNFAEAYFNLGNAYSKLKSAEKAIYVFEKAIENKPDYLEAKVELLKLKDSIGNWNGREGLISDINKLITSNNSINPMGLMTIETNPKINLERAKSFNRKLYNRTMDFKCNNRSSKTRIGYFSGNFYKHPVIILLVRILELHDKNDVEVYAYSWGVNKEDNYTKRVKNAVDTFRDIDDLNENDAVNTIRNDNLDIAIDLMGYTENCRPALFERRVAPVQVSYLGYPGSLGSKAIDYIIGDKIIIPPEDKKYYSEKVIYMDGCYQCNDDTQKISELKFNREDFGLPQNAFIFTCFNSTYKISSEEFDCWMNILRRVKNSVLWISISHNCTKNNLDKELMKRGVSSNRVIYTKSIPLDKHIKRHGLGNLFLDTFKYNAGATAWISLYAGLPLLTLIGQSYSSRMASSLLNSLDLKELIVYNKEEYVSQAIKIALDKEYYKFIKSKLDEKRLTSALFNSRIFTRNLEVKLKSLISR